MPRAGKRCPARRELYAEQLDQTRHFLTASASSDPRVQSALADPTLIDALDAVLHDYVTLGVAKDLACLRRSGMLYAKDKARKWDSLDEILPVGGVGPSNPKAVPPDKHTDPWVAYQRYFTEMIRPSEVCQCGKTSSGIEAFYARYPLLRTAVAGAANNFRQNVKLACTRVVKDWDDIQGAFCGQGVLLDRLERIATTGNDFHKGGKQVLILTFATSSDKPLRVVYKPSSVEIDCRLVGNSAVVNVIAPQGYQQKESLTELVNQRIDAELTARLRDRLNVRPLPTYRILPYDRDSIPSAYGYIEFLTHRPAVEAAAVVGDAMAGAVGAEIVRRMAHDNRFIDGSDWITQEKSDTRAFHFQFGALMAMAASVSLCDLHVQNVIVHRHSPHLIDLEEALKKPMSSVLDTYLPLTLGNAADPVGKQLVVREDQTPDLKVGFESAPIEPSSAVLFRWRPGGPGTDPGRAILASIDGAIDDDADANRERLILGARTVFAALATGEGYSRVRDWVRACDRTIARYVPRATSQYAQALRQFYAHYSDNELRPLLYSDFSGWNDLGRSVSGQAGPGFFVAEVRKVRKAWMDRMSAATQRSWNLPSFAVEHPDHAWRDYLNGDVPSFYRRLGDRDLRNSAGDVVNVRDVIAWQRQYIDDPGPITDDCGRGSGVGETTPTIVNYFPSSAVDMALAQLDSNRQRHRADEQQFLATMLEQIVTGPQVLAGAVRLGSQGRRRVVRQQPRVAKPSRARSSQPNAGRGTLVGSTQGEKDDQ